MINMEYLEAHPKLHNGLIDGGWFAIGGIVVGVASHLITKRVMEKVMEDEIEFMTKALRLKIKKLEEKIDELEDQSDQKTEPEPADKSDIPEEVTNVYASYGGNATTFADKMSELEESPDETPDDVESEDFDVEGETPYMITHTQFDHDDYINYDKVFGYYLVDEDKVLLIWDKIMYEFASIEQMESYLGDSFLMNFGYGCNDPDSVFVRNDVRMDDFAISRIRDRSIDEHIEILMERGVLESPLVQEVRD